MSIRLSPKHGVNPTIAICFWCGKERGDIALLGRIGRKDKEAPEYSVLDYEPCEECKANMAKGIAILEASTAPLHDGQPEIQEGVWPTGRWSVIREECRKSYSWLPETGNKVFMDTEAYQLLFGGGEES